MISISDTYRWQQAVAEAQRYVTTSTIPTDVNHYEWRVTTRITRPGMGQTIDATWCDGEYLVQIIADSYSTPLVSVAELNWIHSNDDEQCDCDFCVEESPASSSNSDVVRDYFNKVVQEALKDIQRADSTQHPGENTLGVYEEPGKEPPHIYIRTHSRQHLR